jgi:hypothetical protein
MGASVEHVLYSLSLCLSLCVFVLFSRVFVSDVFSPKALMRIGKHVVTNESSVVARYER